MSTPFGDLEALARQLETMNGIESTRVLDDSVLAYVKSDGPRLPEILTFAEHAGCAITDVAVTETTLETVFIQLTGRDLRE